METMIMTKQPPMLEERIDAALQTDAAVTSADLFALIEETEIDIAKADQLWKMPHQTSPLDSEARQLMTDTILAADRLRPLLPKLWARLDLVQQQEQVIRSAKRKAVWLADYDASKNERDALAEELREIYPNAASMIVNILGRLATNDEVLAKLHRDRPDGVEQYLRSAELHARGLESFTENTPSLLASVRLFDWDTGRQIWPPPRPSMASAFAATSMQVCDRRFTADWALAREANVEAVRARQAVSDAQTQQMTLDQEERQNREERERFAQSGRRA
jgi:hypothetical protein